MNGGPSGAPLAPETLESALRPFGEGTMLPARAYTADEVLAWERRHFFAGSWFCVGRSDELRRGQAGGSVRRRGVLVGNVPVVLTFPSDGTVRALANTCRHRGHEIVADGCAETRRTLVCPYHAWTYALDGTLIGAPGLLNQDRFQPADHGLILVPIEVWHGWIFVNATGDAAAFADHIGALESLVSPYHPERLIHLARRDYEIAANWKVVVENHHRCYHCPLIHPELCRVSPPRSGKNYDLPGAWVGGSMDLREHATTMSLDGHSSGRLIDGVDPRTVLYLGLFPQPAAITAPGLCDDASAHPGCARPYADRVLLVFHR